MKPAGWLALAALLALISGGAWKLTRGLRNNNPGNIRDDGRTPWLGLDNPRGDGAFLRFVSPEYGIRALARLLLAYQDRHGINTIRGIISRYAPASENDTAAYIASVSQHVGASPDAPLDLHNPGTLRAIIEAIIRHENGIQPYDVATINNGMAMAGVAA